MNLPVRSEWDDEELLDDDPGLDIEILRRRREKVFTFLALLLILGTSLFTAFHFLRAQPVTSEELRAAAQQAVREYFVGRAVQFAGANMTQVTHPAEGIYEVMANFVAVTPEGRASYYIFHCTLKPVPDGHWRPYKLDLIPQE